MAQEEELGGYEEVNPEDEDTQEERTTFTDWANEPTVMDLKQDLQDAYSDRDSHIARVDTWLDNLHIRGKAKVKSKKGHSSIVPQLIRKQAEWRYAALTEPFLSTEDVFNTAPVANDDKKAAIQNGIILNNQFNTKLNKTKFIDEYVRTAVDEGTVVTKVTWDFEEEEQEVEVPQFNYQPSVDPQVAQQHEQIHQMMTQAPEQMESVPQEWQQAHQLTMQHGVPIAPIPAPPIMEMQMVTVKNQPALEVCNYNNLTIDPTCHGNLDKAEFIVHSFDTSKSELEKDGKYSNLDMINIEGNSILAEPDHVTEDQSSFNFTDTPRKKFVAYEYWGYWDINDDGIVRPIVATYVGSTMIRLEENPFPDQGLPFVVAQYLPVRRSIYGEPDGALLEDNQKIIGAVTRGMIDVMGRSANGQMGTRKDALDVTNKRKFDAGQDYEYNGSVDPRLGFHMHTYPEIPQSAGLMIQMQNQEAESLTGVKAFASGISGQALGETATGIRSALDATSKRELGILRRLAEGVKQIGRKIISMNAVFLDETEVVRITNEEFIEINRDDLAGNFDVKLSISTAEADEHKAQELAFMLQTMGNTMPPEMSQIILADIARLRKMPELSKRIEEFKPQPDPLAEKMKELEIAKLDAEIRLLQSEGMENQAEAQLDGARAQTEQTVAALNMAKVNTEQAKASNLASDTDSKNLDFVEKESGVEHARDVDKITSQARGNIALEAAKGRFGNKGS